MIPTDSKILSLLDELSTKTADDLETQFLDFKPWTDAKTDMKVAVYETGKKQAAAGIDDPGLVPDKLRGVLVVAEPQDFVTLHSKGSSAGLLIVHGVNVCVADDQISGNSWFIGTTDQQREGRQPY